jgi:hypothetical protein
VGPSCQVMKTELGEGIFGRSVHPRKLGRS